MSRGRLIPVMSALVLAGGVASAQPTPGTPADAAAPAEGSAVEPIEDAPPSDMDGTSEDPDAPRSTLAPITASPATPAPTTPTGYPIEEAQRPITLPENMAEVSLSPHFVSSPYIGGDTLRARYGITPRIQLALNYVIGGVYDDPDPSSDKKSFHVGKTGGIEVTVLLKNWVGVRVGVPVYFDPFATSLLLGAPMKFIFGKWAIGGLDDVLNIKLHEFAPRYDFEARNHYAAFALDSNTEQSRGFIRVSGYGVYNHKPNLAILGRLGIENDLGSGGGAGPGTSTASDTVTFLRAGVQFSPRRWFDLGVLAGFEDMSKAGSFGLTGILAVRIRSQGTPQHPFLRRLPLISDRDPCSMAAYGVSEARVSTFGDVRAVSRSLRGQHHAARLRRRGYGRRR